MLIFLCAPYCIYISIFYIWRLLWRTWRHGLKKKSLHSESLIQYLFWWQTISGNSKRILWSCCSILVFLISSLLYLYLYFYRICIFVWCREESKIVQAECNKRMPRLTPGSTFFNQPAQAHCVLCSVFLDAISHPYIYPLFFNQLFSAEHKHTLLQNVICILWYMFCTGTSLLLLLMLLLSTSILIAW